MNRYQFLEIRNINGVEVAYLLDTKTGRVLKSLVEDYTGGMVEEEREVFPTRPVARTTRRVPVMEEVDEEIALSPAKTVPAKSVIPPHLAGIFNKPGTQGEAFETRTI